MYFTFIGELVLNGLETEHPFLKSGTTKTKAPYKTINAIVRAAQNNSAFVEMFGMERKSIKTRNSEGNNIEIAWSDRLDESVIKDVDSRNRFTIVDGDDRHEFITELDLIEYIEEHYEELNGKRVQVTGQVSKNEYNGKVSNRYQFKSIYVLDEDSKQKNGLQVRGQMYFSKEDVDIADWAEGKTITISAYTREYVGKDDDGNSIFKYYELPITFDASKVDFENERHVKMVKFRLKQLGCELTDDNKVKVVMKKGYYSNNITLNYINGAEEVEFTYDMLTDTQKEMVDLGMKEVKDFKPSGTTYGERIVVFKVVNFDLRGDYEDGIKKEDDDTSAEITDNIYVPVPVEEKVSESEDDALNETTDEESGAEDEEALFS